MRRLARDRAGRDRALRSATLVLARSRGGPGAALRGLLGDGAPAGARHDLGGGRRPAGCGLDRLPVATSRRNGGGPSRRRPGGDPGAGGHLAPLRRRRPLRHPRHQLQPGHVPAPPGRRPAGPRPELPAPAPGLPAGPSRDSRGPDQGPRNRPGPGLHRPHRRHRRPRIPDRPDGLPPTSPRSSAPRQHW